MNGDHDTGHGPDFARSVALELEQLVALGLVERVDDGAYRILPAGRAYLEARRDTQGEA